MALPYLSFVFKNPNNVCKEVHETSESGREKNTD